MGLISVEALFFVCLNCIIAAKIAPSIQSLVCGSIHKSFNICIIISSFLKGANTTINQSAPNADGFIVI